jgi:hypothetical protein
MLLINRKNSGSLFCFCDDDAETTVCTESLVNAALFGSTTNSVEEILFWIIYN